MAVLLVMTGWAVAPHAGRAQSAAEETSSPSDNAYDQLIHQAVLEFRVGNYPEARSLFARAHAVQPNARTLRGMGMAAFEERAYVLCIQHLRAALAETRKPLTAEQRKQVEDVLTRAQGFIAQYELELFPSNAEVTVDAKPPVIVDGTLLLDPGTHEVVVSLEDRRERRQVRAQPNEKLVLRIRLTNKNDSATATASRQEPASLSSRRKWAIVSGGVGAASLATSLGLTLRARSLRDEASCVTGTCPDEAARDQHEKAYTLGTAATAMVVVGGVAAAAGLTLWLWPSGDNPSEQSANRKRARARLSPIVSHREVGMSLRGAW